MERPQQRKTSCNAALLQCKILWRRQPNCSDTFRVSLSPSDTRSAAASINWVIRSSAKIQQNRITTTIVALLTSQGVGLTPRRAFNKINTNSPKHDGFTANSHILFPHRKNTKASYLSCTCSMLWLNFFCFSCFAFATCNGGGRIAFLSCWWIHWWWIHHFSKNKIISISNFSSHALFAQIPKTSKLLTKIVGSFRK